MKVLITPRSFGKNDLTPFCMLKEHHIDVICNDSGRLLSEQRLSELIAGCDGVIIGIDPLTANVMEHAPTLRAVAKYGVGTDNIDLDYCQEHNIIVSRTVGANSKAVADYSFALMLGLARQIIEIDRRCRNFDWTKVVSGDVSGKTLGLIGLGSIGKEMVKRAKGFGMEILAYDIVWDQSFAEENLIIKTDIRSICSESDFISLHLPLTKQTYHLIGRQELSLMKQTSYLINTARGGLIDENALLRALQEKRIAGAGIDVFEEEPPQNTEWFELDNVIFGSHCAASTIGTSEVMSIMAAENLIRDLIRARNDNE